MIEHKSLFLKELYSKNFALDLSYSEALEQKVSLYFVMDLRVLKIAGK
jgi:hypothetical protein